MDSGRKLSGEVYSIKGGSEKYPTFGMDIIIYMQTDLADDRIPSHIQYRVPSKKEVALEPFKMLLIVLAAVLFLLLAVTLLGIVFFFYSVFGIESRQIAHGARKSIVIATQCFA